MKKILLPVLLLLFSFSFVANGQMIESFDATTSDSLWQVNFESAPSSMAVSNNTSDKVEGSASLYVDAKIGALHEWGSFAQYIYALPEGATPLDWSISDTLSIWIKVISAPAFPEYMVFRIQIADRLAEDGDIEQYIYENLTILDGVHDWVELKIPLVEIESDGSYIPDSTGFVIAPSSWGGFTYNDRKLNINKIVQFQLGIITSGFTAGVNLPADSIQVAFDNFQRTGTKAIPIVIFNGIAIPSTLNSWAWGQSAIEVEVGAGATANTNALKWTQGNDGSGWTGFGFDVPVTNLGGAWQQDSVKFKMKAEDGVGALRIQFEGGGGKVGTVFTPTGDNQWHDYAFPLREMTLQDGTTFFDSSQVSVIGLMAEASGIAGKVIYIDDWWTGSPVFDVIPPVAVQNLAVVPGSYTNLVTWSDVPGEETETYSIYYSDSPITDISSAEVVKLNVAENLQIFEHLLRAPVTDQSVSYYYAITCTDKDGNVSAPTSLGSAITNTAKGVATVSLAAPTSFNADGDLSEWAAITPIRMYTSEGNGYVVTNTQITNDADLSVNAYLAMDATNLYIAFDIEDDVVSPDQQSDTWLNDAPDLFIGLYNWHGKPHTSYQRGAQPDYHFRFTKSRGILDGITGGDSILTPGADYFWGEKFPTGYTVEARLPWTLLAQVSGDNLFTPVEGYRLPLDFSINDADDTGTREGILAFSPFNEDQSWADVSRWLYTWIGTLWSPVGIDDEGNLPLQYNLSQNYPNPFNPSTEIRYTLEQAGNVSLKIYDILGREVSALVNQFQNAGQHSVKFDASGLSTGVYFYRIESGSYQSIKKMMLIK